MPSNISRRERPAKAALTLEGIVDAAMSVIHKDGFKMLTMRRVASDLDTGAASLYVYVRNTTELHALLLDRLLGDLDVAWSGRGSARKRLRRLLVDYLELLERQPGLARTAVITWPAGVHYLDLVESGLRLLIACGMPEARAAWAIDVLLQQATAMGAEHGARITGLDQGISDLRAVIAQAAPVRHPILTRIGIDGMTSGDGPGRRDWAIDALLAGLLTTARPGE